MTAAPTSRPAAPSPGPFPNSDRTCRQLDQAVHQGVAVSGSVDTINITFQSSHECKSQHACNRPLSHAARSLTLVLDDFVLGLRAQLQRLADPQGRPTAPPDSRGGTERWR
ncbi:hypothetical protein [Kitasatospora sp. NPDC008115]|uniref:hypothetical protein n=1 Tax=Kitasatospora sp. NPDC008115 TaxID=3364022 RepID=UPI0036EC23FB